MNLENIRFWSHLANNIVLILQLELPSGLTLALFELRLWMP